MNRQEYHSFFLRNGFTPIDKTVDTATPAFKLYDLQISLKNGNYVDIIVNSKIEEIYDMYDHGLVCQIYNTHKSGEKIIRTNNLDTLNKITSLFQSDSDPIALQNPK